MTSIFDPATVTVDTANDVVVVADPATDVVTITQATTSVVSVVGVGPQGPPGTVEGASGLVQKAGDTMTGPLVAAGDVRTPNDASSFGAVLRGSRLAFNVLMDGADEPIMPPSALLSMGDTGGFGTDTFHIYGHYDAAHGMDWAYGYGVQTGHFQIYAPALGDQTIDFGYRSVDGSAQVATNMRLGYTADATNYMHLFGAATGEGPLLTVNGSDTNIPLRLAGKGTGDVVASGRLIADTFAGNGASLTDLPEQVPPRGVTVEAPDAAENITLLYVDMDVTISAIHAVVSGSSPSVTFSVRYGVDRSGAGTEAVTGGITCTDATTGTTTTSFDSAVVPAGSWLWLTTSATSGTVATFHVTVRFA